MQVEFYRHNLDETDRANARRVLESVFLTTGPVCGEFEKRFAEYTGLEHAVALNSCTDALHLALLALGIGPGDEVITTPMTFIASATAILHAGATPVLADVNPATGCLDPDRVREAVTPNTRAILPVHLYGTMCDMPALREIADRHGLAIVEDAAHCVASSRGGVYVGELGDCACYSFYATKNLTCGEGGALATNNGELAEQVRLLRQHGMNKEASDRYHGTYQHWDMIELGYKANLDDIRASLMVDQITRLDEMQAERKRLHGVYSEALAGLLDAGLVELPELRGEPSHHLFTVLVPENMRDELLTHMGANGVGVAVNYRAIHTLTWFRENLKHEPEDFPHACSIGRRTMSLPFYPGLTDEQVAYVVRVLAGKFGKG
ncbi:DegT/DnrJ/EryC1/StrS family aminotransferase [Desulfohalovibrio reitneri]|uniref:DegT/DnrJ/EryC1/StrS family aminotransferase n=1 Tax=Desulfohalovibrio reitneri TaxID=1307759 RepID=UPI00068C5C26|nr:DegT/DnrJ/EryC1/StrS family aminotransferase [Desulfohalovibrio reitneri]